jgi:tetratricopeptide (TPR) repeat protein
VLEHNRLDLISLAAVTAHAVELVEKGTDRCRDSAEALALGKVYERAGCTDRALAAYELAAGDASAHVDVRAEAIYRLGVRLRRDRRYPEAVECWRRILDLKQSRYGRRSAMLAPLREYAVEALAVHHEHRERDYEGARELTVRLLDELESDDFHLTAEAARSRRRIRKTEATRHRMARLDRKLARGPLLDGDRQR